jgi:DNA-binding MarR family transcriptional regulator
MTNVRPDIGTLHGAIANLQQLVELFEHRREQLARLAGLTVAQWRVLEEIAGENFMPSMFARERSSSRAAVSKVLRQLQDKGLITVGVSAENGRHRRYVLTGAGEAAMERVRAGRRRAIEAVWEQFDSAELEHFRAFSALLIERLERHAAESVGKE